MAKYPKHVWDQLRAKTCGEIIKALERDGFEYVCKEGRSLIYRRKSDGRRIPMHYQPNKSYGPGFLKDLFEAIGWTTEKDMRRVKLIK